MTWKMGEIDTEALKLGNCKRVGKVSYFNGGSCSVFVFCVPVTVKNTGLVRQYKTT